MYVSGRRRGLNHAGGLRTGIVEAEFGTERDVKDVVGREVVGCAVHFHARGTLPHVQQAFASGDSECGRMAAGGEMVFAAIEELQVGFGVLKTLPDGTLFIGGLAK